MASPAMNRPKRTHIPSRLMRESLLDKHVVASTKTEAEISILPDVNIVVLGGRSVLDKGKAALFPILREIVRCRKKYKIIIGVGGGARVRHTFHICRDLGIPLGGMAMVAGAVDEQNTRLVQSLLAKDKGITLNKDHFLDLPLWLEAGMIPIMTGMPPYHYWEPPTAGDVPSHGEDLGMFMVSEVLGGRSMIFVKDEDGLYTADPKKDPKAEFISCVEAGELLQMNLPELIIERMVIETMLNARHTRQVQIINVAKPQMLRRALAGEPVGTVIYAGKENHPAKGLWKRKVASIRRGRKNRNGR
ncbi:MAG: uridine kinase [Acidobacteriia bacterium]|nr:uridine kinase [Terriglobia bacterium]